MPERLAYDEAMLFSSIRLRIQDPELKQGKVETVKIKTSAGIVERPWGIEGGFAVVYKFRTKSGSVRAMRCFRVPMSSDTQFRYERIGPYFHAHAREITAGFKYYDPGIVVKEQGKPPDQAYPIIEMDWVDGVTLVDKIDELCKQRDQVRLKDLAEQWLSILRTMRDAHIAHGDLAGVNVMVRVDGKMLLIDYDGVYIPEFSGLTQLLLGQEEFQHPQMSQRTFHEYMDDFSALVIYIALIALAARPELWNKYTKIGPDGKLLDVNLLFRPEDFKDPQQSKLIRDLEQIGDQHVRSMVQELKRACSQPVNDVRFPFALIDPNYNQKQALAKLERAIQANDDLEIVNVWFPLLEQYVPAQGHRSRVLLAQQRVRALQIFRTALKTHDVQTIIDSYNPAQLDTCRTVTADERQLLSLARSFLQAYSNDDDDALVTTAEELQNANLLVRIAFTVQQKQRLALAQQRKNALQNLQAAFKNKSVEQIASAYALIQNGFGLTKEERQRAELAIKFMRACNIDDDNLLLAAYDAIQDFTYRSFFIFTPSQEQRVIIAKKRKMALAQFRSALVSRSPFRLVSAYDTLLDNTTHVTQEEREQLDLARTLVEAFHADDEDRLLAADAALQQSAHQAYFVLTEEEQQRIALIRQQKAALLKFQFALNSRSPRQLVASYNPILDTSKRLVAEERAQLAVARLFVEAFNTDDDDAFIAADKSLQKPSLQNFFVFTAQEQQRIALAKQRAEALGTFRRVLVSGTKSAQKIVDAYNASLLDASSSLTDVQREVVSAARQYLAMYSAVQEAIQEDNDDVIRRAYNPTLGQRFSDFSPDEQKCVDKAMLSRALEELLDKKEYGQAIRMAQTIQATTGKEVSDGLAFKLRRATMRFIKEHDLTHITVQIEERADSNYAMVYWQWPQDDLIRFALIVWRSDRWPERPSERSWQDPQWRYTWSGRKINILDGMCTFSIEKYAHIYVKSYVAILDAWDQEQKWRFSDGDGPTSYAEATSPQMIWRLQ